MVKHILALALAAGLAACANGGDYGTQLPGQAGSNEPGVSFTALGACEQAMLLAALIDPKHDTVTDLDQAVERCDTFADWSAASAKYPDALDGADPRKFAQNRCAYGEGLANKPLCLEVGQPGS
jgi:hypothetical protein